MTKQILRGTTVAILLTIGLLLITALLTIFQPFPYLIFLIIRTALLFGVLLCLAKFLFELSGQKSASKELKNLAVFTVSSLAILIFIEIIFTFIPRSHGVGFSYAGKNWDYFYLIKNEAGNRDQSVYGKDANKSSIVFIGDSFTEGRGIKNIKDRFPEILQKRLNDQYEIYNLGSGGLHSTDQIEILNNLSFTPDIIVHQYYGNDIEGDANEFGIHRKQIQGYQDLSFFSEGLVRSSYLLNFIYWLYPHEYLAPYFEYLSDSYKSNQIWRAHETTLKQIKAYAERKDIDLITLVMPYLQQPALSKELYQGKVAKIFDDPRSKSYICTIDDQIESIASEQRIVNKNDPHASEQIQRLIADQLASTIDYHISQ